MRAARAAALCCVCAGVLQLLPGAWILAKAELAQVLIARAWRVPGRILPWPWADTWPVLRMQVPRLGVDMYVLEGARGNALAFGPGRMHQYGASPGSLVIAGHRDTHFSFLQHLRTGDSLRLTHKNGTGIRWAVASTAIVDSRHQSLEPAAGGFWLVTCFPFDSLQSGGALRYVVRLERR